MSAGYFQVSYFEITATEEGTGTPVKKYDLFLKVDACVTKNAMQKNKLSNYIVRDIRDIMGLEWPRKVR